jgi:hypothetical protein
MVIVRKLIELRFVSGPSDVMEPVVLVSIVSNIVTGGCSSSSNGDGGGGGGGGWGMVVF